MASRKVVLNAHASGALVLVCSLLLSLVSILCIAFKSASLAIYKGNGEGLYPSKLTTNTPGLLTATASIDLILSLPVVVVSAYLMRRGRPMKLLLSERIAVITLLSANAILSAVNFIYQFVLAGQSTHFDLSYEHETTENEEKPFILEAWACGLSPYISSSYNVNLDIQCAEERASRGLSLVLWLLAMLGLLVRDMKSCHVLVTPKQKPSFLQENDWT
ncbi:hypothetical protein GGS24DRAFT_458431 [Hypoxylon argillaceum]|nr:hypothetical protein GGS24DRAFT_458431 [Hypoxylon argillaceum]